MSEQLYCEEVDQNVSMCIDCARHSSIKRLINEKPAKGLCAFCENSHATIRDPENSQPFVMLVRSLIRFYWDEYEFNPHWGGDSVCSLFERPNNPIVTPPKSSTYLDEFDHFLQEPVYPPADKGVAIYAGFDDGMRLLNRAISTSTHPELSEISSRLLYENFFQVEPALEALLNPFILELSSDLPTGNIWYRARLGQKAKYRDMQGWKGIVRHQPWQGDEIGAPSPLLAGNGRLNRAGVSVLYLASDVTTAVAEIRPHPGHFISVGAFKNCDSIRIADFSPNIEKYSSNDVRLDYYHIIDTLDRMMSFPVTPEDRKRYLLTQLLAEYLTRSGFDGVKFKSSLSNGQNICIFHPNKFKFVKGYSEVRKITSLDYTIDAALTIVDPAEEEMVYKIR